MKEHPILFSTPMIQAILAGNKTQTRRIVKPQPELQDRTGFHWKGRMYGIGFSKRETFRNFESKCPYGKIGDVLWVRETFCNYHGGIIYKADGKYNGIVDGDLYQWKPSIFMPKEACRIKLEITDIRVERVQEISEADAIKEGAPDSMSIDELRVLQGMDWIIPSPFQMHQFGFMAIWCKINGQESWLNNPWVWVISFKRIN
jgi:hypothetical protein